jgi:hypothetical protein
MAKLVGRDTLQGSGQLLSAALELWTFDNGYAATAGTATSAYIYVTDWWTASAAKVVVYDSSGTLVATSDAFSSAQGTGWISKSIGSLSLNAATYYLGILVDTGYLQVDCENATDYDMYTNTSGSYASPPASIPVPLDGASQRGEIAIYLDGTAGGGGVRVVAPSTLAMLGVQ